MSFLCSNLTTTACRFRTGLAWECARWSQRSSPQPASERFVSALGSCSHTRVSGTRVSDQVYDHHLILNSCSPKTMFYTSSPITLWAVASPLYSSSLSLSLASPNLLFYSIYWGFLKIPIAKIMFYSIATFSYCVCVTSHFFIVL